MNKFLFDFFPLMIFGGVYYFTREAHGLTYAIIAIMIATVIQTALHYILHKKIEKIHLINLLLIVGLGGISLLFNDESNTVFKWKPTILYWVFSLVLLATRYIGSKTIPERILGAMIEAPQPIWTKVNLSWVLFFAIFGAINLIVAYSFENDTWVMFKLIGGTVLLLLFMVVQLVALRSYIKPEHELEQIKESKSSAEQQ
ncbi:MAG: septation protein IspZ [Gammaproteobacteria bacterium]|nr:MAG: septation protein IspZ [Gammaproteobacteria bacterium]